MDKAYFKASLIHELNVYKNYDDLGVTKIKVSKDIINGIETLIIAFKGTDTDINDLSVSIKDWFRNFNLSNVDGIKKHAHVAAEAVAVCDEKIFLQPGISYTDVVILPKLIVCHSQGVEGLAYFINYCDYNGVDKCVCLETPPILCGPLKKLYLKNCLLVINDRDIVPYLGAWTFNHPICETLYFDNKGNAYHNLTVKQIFWKSCKRFYKRKERFSDHPIKAVYEVGMKYINKK